MGPTPTRILGMRLSCNFVNGYTIAYRVQYTRLHVYTRASPTDILEEKRACRTSRQTSRRGVRLVRVRLVAR